MAYVAKKEADIDAESVEQSENMSIQLGVTSSSASSTNDSIGESQIEESDHNHDGSVRDKAIHADVNSEP